MSTERTGSGTAPGNSRGQGGHGPREFGRDGTSGILTPDRAVRAREVSRPQPADLARATQVLDSLLARASGRRR
ncbi:MULTISPECIES: hypothetical protein [unclassified Luteococcus]|uniref:hypothetical protein n=1 Tax=unclassified Luteococcus TaxID=2639923 RepID=UPI00313D4C5F